MRLIVNIFRIITFAIFIIFIAMEIFLRIYKKEEFVIHKYPKIYKPDTLISYIGIPYIEGEIRRPGIHKKFKLNNHGFYGPDFTTDKPDSIFRIIVTGASGVEGIWADHQESFPMKLQRKFREEGYRHVEVINCAVSGSQRDLQNIRMIEQYLISYKPNIVLHEATLPIESGNHVRDTFEDYSVLYEGNNDEERKHSKYIVQTKVKLVKLHRLITDLYDMSYCFRLYVRLNSEGAKPGSIANTLSVYAENKASSWQYSSFESYDIDKSIQILNSLNDKLSQNNSKFIMFSYGAMPDDTIIMKFKAPVLFLKLDGNDLSNKYDGHFNEKAHEIIAQRLFNELIKHDVRKI